jgi:hypothetical protein
MLVRLLLGDVGDLTAWLDGRGIEWQFVITAPRFRGPPPLRLASP